MESLYVSKARTAFDEGHNKQALVYLSHITNWTPVLATFVATCTYNLWRDNQKLILKQWEDERVSDLDFPHCADDTVSSVVVSSFSRILDGRVPFEMIGAVEYIRLTHIYLSEGNLEGALSICNLAAARGYLEDCSVVAQSFLLLRALGNSIEATHYRTFLISEVVTLSTTSTIHRNRDEQFDINLSAMLLFFANELLNELKTCNKLKKPQMELLNTFCREYFFLQRGLREVDLSVAIAFIEDYDQLFAMGQFLLDTPYILLAEELFWFCFSQRPLEKLAISIIIRTLCRTFRKYSIGVALIRAYEISPWNSFVRGSILLAKNEFIANFHDWSDLFQHQERSAMYIQKLVRGHRIRNYWPIERKLLENIRGKFKLKMEIAEKRYATTLYILLETFILNWKAFAVHSKKLKFHSSIIIQTFIRKALAVCLKHRLLEAICETNGRYMLVSQLCYEKVRLNHFRKWFDFYFVQRRSKSTSLIANVLMLNGYNRLLVGGMSVLLSILRIHKRHTKMRIIKVWLQKWKAAQVRHAITSIRFFIRNCLVRVHEKAQAVILELFEKQISGLSNTKFRSNYSALLKCMWHSWRYIFNHRVHLRLREYMILSLQQKFRLNKAKSKLMCLKVRRECQVAYAKWFRVQKMIKYLKFWRCLRAVDIVQRGFRCHAARKRYVVHYSRRARIVAHYSTKCRFLTALIIRKWIQFTSISKLDIKRRLFVKHKLFTWWKFVVHLTLLMLKRPQLYGGFERLHTCFLKFQLRKLSCQLKSTIRIRAAHKISSIIISACLRVAWINLRNHRSEQRLLSWIAVKSATRWCCFHFISMNSLKTLQHTYKSIFWNRWCQLWKIRRECHERAIQTNAIELAKKATLESMRQFQAAIGIQRFYRMIVAKIRCFKLLTIQRRRIEFASKILSIKCFVLLNHWKSKRSNRERARTVLHTAIFQFAMKCRNHRNKIRLRFLSTEIIQRHRQDYLNSLRSVFLMWMKRYLVLSTSKLVNMKVNNSQVLSYPLDINSINRSVKRPLPLTSEFQHKEFFKVWKSMQRTGTLICDSKAQLSYSEWSLCAFMSESIFVDYLDDIIALAIGRHFRGRKLILHSFQGDYKLISFLQLLLSCTANKYLSEREQWPSLFLSDQTVADNSLSFKLSLTNMSIPHHVVRIMCSVMSTRVELTYPLRRVEELDFNTVSFGALGTLTFLFASPVMSTHFCYLQRFSLINLSFFDTEVVDSKKTLHMEGLFFRI
jgi:hypothetical protein